MEFEAMFKTEQDCLDYISSIRWPQSFICPTCGSIRYWKKNKGRFECRDCGKESTVTNGTIFHKSTKPLLIWFHAIWWMVAQKNGGHYSVDVFPHLRLKLDAVSDFLLITFSFEKLNVHEVCMDVCFC